MPPLRNALVALATSLLFIHASAAHANSVAMVSCAGAQPLPQPWEWRTSGPASAWNDCERGNGEALLAPSSQAPPGTYGKWQLKVPATVRVRSISGQIRLNQ